MKISTHQKKLILTCAGIIIVLIISWSFAFKKTMVSYMDLNQLESELNDAQLSREQVLRLGTQLKTMRLTHGFAKDSVNSQLIFKRIADLSQQQKSLKIVSFPDVHCHELNKYTIETLQVELEGDYKELAKFILELENNASIGRLVSVGFKLHKDVRTKKEYLRLNVYIQNTHNNKKQDGNGETV